MLKLPLTYTVRRSLRLTAKACHVTDKLSREQVDEIMERHELYCSLGGAGGVLDRFYGNQVAANRPCEDTHSQTLCAKSNDYMFAVYDGHGGVSCARSVSRRLPLYTAAALQPPAPLQRHLQALHHGTDTVTTLVQQLHDPHHHQQQQLSAVNDIEPEIANIEYSSYIRFVRRLLDSGSTLSDDKAGALSAAFTALDSDLGTEALAAATSVAAPPPPHPAADAAAAAALPAAAAGGLDCGAVTMATARSGCAALAALVCASSARLHVASVGDCGAVLGVRGADWQRGQWQCRRLTRAHTSAASADEVRRVCDAHPSTESRPGSGRLLLDGRLLGLLVPLRAFGDFGFKWSRQLQLRLARLHGQDETALYKGLLTPPYLTAQPEVVSHQLTPRDRFLVLASDGVWDKLSGEEVVALVGRHLDSMESRQAGSRALPAAALSLADSASRSVASATSWRLGELARALHEQRHRQRHAPLSPDANTATHVLRHALAGSGGGGVAAGGEEARQAQERVAQQLAVPVHMARQFRDDMTISVIVFNTEFLRSRAR